MAEGRERSKHCGAGQTHKSAAGLGGPVPSLGRCRSCGAECPTPAARCPECGAPALRETRGGFGRASAAGIFLLSLMVLGVFQGISFLIDPGLEPASGIRLGGPILSVAGVVRDPTGAPVNNVTVTLAGPSEQITSTDAQGGYRLENATPGVHDVVFTHPDQGSLRIRTVLLRDATMDAGLPGAPGEARYEESAAFRSLERITRALGAVVLGAGVLAAAGAAACFRRRGWGLALAGAIAGLAASLPLSLLIGGLTVVLVATARPEFRPRRPPPVRTGDSGPVEEKSG